MRVEQIAAATREQLIAEIERLEGELQRRREAHRKTWRQLEHALAAPVPMVKS